MIDRVDHSEIVRLYGPWRLHTPNDAKELLSGYVGRWWIPGGWAMEAFTGIRRAHGDLDVSIPRLDAAGLRTFLAGRLDVWAADNGTLRPLTSTLDGVPAGCSNLWLRENGASPWEYDMILESVQGVHWMYRRDTRIQRPVTEISWTRDDISYLRPEIQLLYKAKAPREKDEIDFSTATPLLDPPAREWLRVALLTTHPGHPWLAQLQ